MKFNNKAQAKFSDIGRGLIKSKGVYIDDHDGQEKKLAGLVVLERDTDEGLEIHYCPFIEKTEVFSLNPLEVKKDGTIHLSFWSVGGTIHTNNTIAAFKGSDVRSVGKVIEILKVEDEGAKLVTTWKATSGTINA